MTERTIPALALNDRGVYEIRWSEKRGDGWRSREKSTRCRDLRGAELVMARWLLEREDAPVDHLTVNDALDEYMRDWAIPRGSETTERNNLTRIRQHLGDLHAAAVSQDDVDRYVSIRQRTVRAPTIRRELTTFQAALNRTFHRRKLPPVHFSKPADSVGRVLWLNEAQEQEIIASAHKATPSAALFFLLGSTYGARSGAMQALRFIPEQVNFITNQIDFHEPGARITRKRRPKGPMTPAVRAAMVERFKDRGAGARELDATVADDFGAWMEAIGYGWVTPHVLKHTAITLMLRGGVDPMDVSAATSTDLKTIMKFYRHYTEDEVLSHFTARRGK